MAMYLKIGNLYYWQHRVVVEYVGISKEGKKMFKTTNGGIISLSQDKIKSEITEDNNSRNYI